MSMCGPPTLLLTQSNARIKPLITLPITQLTGPFTTPPRSDHARPIARLAESNAFGTVRVSTLINGVHTSSCIVCHASWKMLLTGFHSRVRTKVEGTERVRQDRGECPHERVDYLVI